MRYYKTINIYKASNVEFNPETIQAYSYRWWKFVDKIKGKVVFNDFRYSVSTSKHQSKVRSLLHELGIEVDYYIEAPRGLQDLNEAIIHYSDLIRTLEWEIEKPRSQKAKNEERKALIKQYQAKIKLIQKLSK